MSYGLHEFYELSNLTNHCKANLSKNHKEVKFVKSINSGHS